MGTDPGALSPRNLGRGRSTFFSAALDEPGEERAAILKVFWRRGAGGGRERCAFEGRLERGISNQPIANEQGGGKAGLGIKSPT